QPACHEPRHRHRALADNREKGAVSVAQLEQPAQMGGVQADSEDFQTLEGRGNDIPVAPASHLRQGGLLSRPHGLRLLGQEVTKTGDVSRSGTCLRLRSGEETSRPVPRRRRYSSSSWTPSPGFAGYSPDLPPREAGFAGTPGAGTPSPGFAGYSPDFAGEREGDAASRHLLLPLPPRPVPPRR